MAGAKSFGLNRISQALGNVGITTNVLPSAGPQTVTGFDVSAVDYVADPVALLGTGSLLYAAQHLGNNLFPVSGIPDTDPLPAAASGSVAILTAAKLVAIGSNDALSYVVSIDSLNYASQGGDDAILVSQPADISLTDAPGDAAQASIGAAGGSNAVHVVTSIDATLIIAPTINQPLVLLELVQLDGAGDPVLWSRQFGVGAAVANGLVQSVSLSGLRIAVAANAGVELRFSAASVAGAAQSVAFTYHSLVG